MLKVAVVIATRSGELSRSCLEQCHRQTDSLAAEGKYSFSIFTNPEGREGCLKVWTLASQEGADFFIWMDEDLRLGENAFSVLMENSEFLRHTAVIAGTVASDDGQLLFGGRTKHGRLIEPDAVIPVPCRFYDLNLVMIPASVFPKLETPCLAFQQGLFDYGAGGKVAKAGVARVIAPGVLARTAAGLELADRRSSKKRLRLRLLALHKSILDGISVLWSSLSGGGNSGTGSDSGR